jgi:hypothetical protein
MKSAVRKMDMNNEQILLEKWRTLPSDKQQEVLDFITSIEPGKTSYQPKTEPGRKLWQHPSAR